MYLKLGPAVLAPAKMFVASTGDCPGVLDTSTQIKYGAVQYSKCSR